MKNNGLFVSYQHQYLKIKYEEILWVEDLGARIGIHTTHQVYQVNYAFESVD